MATELFSIRGDAFPDVNEAGVRPRPATLKEHVNGPSVGEALEARRLLAATLSGGVLTVTGTSSGETITVFRLVSSGPPASDQTWVRISGITPDVAFNTSSITSKIVVNAGAGNDTVKIEDTDDVAEGGGGLGTVGYPINKITELNGADGVDTINGGDLADTVNGGDGDDTIKGRRGNDKLIGYGGNDTLEGGDGNDYIFGGQEDYSGTEVGYGSDHLTGGPGTDYMYGGGDNDVLDAAGDFGTGDYLDGGVGNDTWFGDGDETLVRLP